MKLVLQTEATECGLASLAMVARHHGHKTDLNAMRQRFGASLMGARLRDLMKIAEQLSLGSRALWLEIKLGELATHRLRLEGVPVRRQTALAELRAALSSLRAQLAQVARQGSIVLQAPVADRIAALPISGGQSMRPRQLAVSLLPRGGRLEAELFAPTRAAGFIQTGQTVRREPAVAPAWPDGSDQELIKKGKSRILAAAACRCGLSFVAVHGWGNEI